MALYDDMAAAQAATAAAKASIDRNNTGAAPEGRGAEHRTDNATRKSSIASLRATESSDD